MRITARYTLFLGFSIASIAAFVVMNFGTDFTTMTAILYLYGFVCVAGGLIGHRRAYLKHSEGISSPSLRHILGFNRVRSLMKQNKWFVELEDDSFEAASVSLTENLISVKRDVNGRMTAVSYPRKTVVSCRKLSSSL